MCKICRKIINDYNTHYDNEIQGCCLVIADEIHKQIDDSTIVAGYLCMCGIKRQHWWVVDKDNNVHDPMGDLYKDELNFRREEVHRDIDIFLNNLIRYERYRI